MPIDDQHRLLALRSTRLLDSAPEEAFDRFTRLAAAAVGAPVSLVSLVDEDRQVFKSQLGLAEPWATVRQTPLSHSFCQIVVADDAPLIVTDARTDPRVAANLAIEDLGVVAYAGVPLRSPGGHVLGSVCAIDPEPREWTEADIARLTDVAGLVTRELELRETLARAERRNADLEDATRGLRSLHAELEAHQRDAETARSATVTWAAHLADEVSTPLHAARGLLEGLMTGAVLDQAARDDLKLVDATVLEALVVVDEGLAAADPRAGGTVVRVGPVDVGDLLHSLRGMMRPLIRPGVAFVIDEPRDIPLLHTDAGKVAQILRNLVSNALRHTASGGVRVQTTLSDDGADVAFGVRDTGEGIPAAFRQRIFEGDAGAAGGSPATGSGVGLPLAAELAALLGGSVTLTRNTDTGATFTATVPVRFASTDPRVTVLDDVGDGPPDLLA